MARSEFRSRPEDRGRDEYEPAVLHSFHRPLSAGAASPPCSARPTPARPTSPSSACSATQSGMIGLPLRLLAREVYDKIVARVGRRPGGADHRRGEDQAAARRASMSAPSRPCRSSSRSTSSPSTRSSSPPTPSAAMSSPTGCCTRAARARRCCSAPRPCAMPIRELLPGANFVSRPRLSQAHLCRRQEDHAAAARARPSSASRPSEVYAIAELIRRQRGGAAVVLGAL